jgi:hypothetical protein
MIMKQNPQNTFLATQEMVGKSGGTPTGQPSDANTVFVFPKCKYTLTTKILRQLQGLVSPGSVFNFRELMLHNFHRDILV